MSRVVQSRTGEPTRTPSRQVAGMRNAADMQARRRSRRRQSRRLRLLGLSGQSLVSCSTTVRELFPESRPPAELAVSEDDFEAETRSEAAHYAAVQANETERERQRQENKRLKEQGLAPRPLPKKIKELRKVHTAYSEEDDEEDDDEEEDEEVDERPARSVGSKPRTHPRKDKKRYYQPMSEWQRQNTGRDDELRYEGRESASAHVPHAACTLIICRGHPAFQSSV